MNIFYSVGDRWLTEVAGQGAVSMKGTNRLIHAQLVRRRPAEHRLNGREMARVRNISDPRPSTT